MQKYFKYMQFHIERNTISFMPLQYFPCLLSALNKKVNKQKDRKPFTKVNENQYGRPLKMSYKNEEE